MSEEKRRIFMPGERGYLGTQLIKRLLADPRVELIIGADPKNEIRWEEAGGRVVHLNMSVLDSHLVKVINDHQTDTVVPMTWAFNPRRDRKEQFTLDVVGIKNVFNSALRSGVAKHFVYPGSTTAYGQFSRPSGERALREEEFEYWVKNPLADDAYQYSIDKACADQLLQTWQKDYGDKINIFWMRGAIVLGPNIPLENVVAKMAQTFGPVMFRARGYNPPMQFVSEYDTVEILYRAIMEKWTGVVNVTGGGFVRYSEIIKILGKIEIPLPARMLKVVCGILWKLRRIDFPPGILGLIMYPWLGDNSKLKHHYHHEPWYSSVDAVKQLAERLNPTEQSA